MTRRPLVLILLAAACGGEERSADEPAAATSVPAPPAATTSVDSAGVTAIRTTDGTVELALRGDRVEVGLSDKVIGRVRDKLAADSADSSSGLGGMIKGVVSSTVQGALATRIDYPVDQIEEISYDGKRIRMVVRGKGPQLENTRVNKRPLLASFAPEDARRFVRAVREAQLKAQIDGGREIVGAPAPR